MARHPWHLSSFLILSAAAVGLSACGTVGGVFGRGGDDPEEVASTAETEADDDRIAVLALKEELVPDLRFFGEDLSIPPAFANADWAQPGGEPDHVMHHLSGPDAFDLAWRAKVGEGGDMRSPLTAPPVVAQNTVYTVDTTATVSAFDAISGDEKWRRALTPDLQGDGFKWFGLNKIDPSEVGFGGGVAYQDGRIFVTSGFGFTAALDASSGEVLWQTDLDAPVRNPPTAVNGLVYALTTSNQIVALDQRTGEQAWSYESFEEVARFLSTGSVAVDGDMAIIPFSSGEVVALDAENGRFLWSTTIGRSSRLNALSNLNDIAGSPVIDRGAIFAVSHAGQISAIDSRTGRIAWEKGVGGLNMPWVSGDYVFMVSIDSELVAFSREDGAVVWLRQLDGYENMKKNKKPITWSGPILAGNALILTSSAGKIIQVSPKNGATLAEYKMPAGSTIPPVIADGRLYLIDEDARLQAWQ